MNQLVLGEADNNRELDVAVGTSVTIRLPENPSTGFRWQLNEGAADGLELVANEFEPSTALMPGAGGLRVFRFVARSAGPAQLELSYAQPWDRVASPERIFRVRLLVLG